MHLMIYGVLVCAILVGSLFLVNRGSKRNKLATVASNDIIVMIKARESLDRNINKKIETSDKRTRKKVSKWLNKNSGDII